VQISQTGAVGLQKCHFASRGLVINICYFFVTASPRVSSPAPAYSNNRYMQFCLWVLVFLFGFGFSLPPPPCTKVLEVAGMFLVHFGMRYCELKERSEFRPLSFFTFVVFPCQNTDMFILILTNILTHVENPVSFFVIL